MKIIYYRVDKMFKSVRQKEKLKPKGSRGCLALLVWVDGKTSECFLELKHMVLYIRRARLQTSECKVNRQTALRRKSTHGIKGRSQCFLK